MSAIIFRTEAGPEVGYARLARCLTLMAELGSRHDTALVLRGPGSLRRRLLAAGYPVRGTRALAAAIVDATALVSDLSHEELGEEMLIAASLARHLSFTDLGVGIRRADLLVDGSVAPFLAGGSPPCAVEAGLDYAVLDPRLRRLRACPRSAPARPARIAVVADRPLSGEQQDLLETTRSLLRGEASLSRPREFPAGRSYAAWLDAADLVLSLGASPLYAAAVLGIPAVVVAADPFAAAAGRRFAALGFGQIPVGQMLPSAETLASSLVSLLEDGQRREAMTKRGRSLVDGRGTGRVVALIDAMTRNRFPLVSRPFAPEVASCTS